MLLILSCGSKPFKGKKAQPTPTPNSKDVVATIDGKQITYGELDEAMRPQLYRLEERIYAMKLNTLNELVSKKIMDEEAKKQGITVEELLKKEVKSKSQIDEKEVNEFYNRFKDRIQGTDAEKKKQLREIFLSRKERETEANFMENLKRNHKVDILLQPPEPLTVDVSADDDPYKGSKQAPVTIIEFSDFQCPYCKKATETIKEVVDSYKGKVKLVFRDFPLPMHKDAELASIASECADDQDKFWDYHDKLFANQQALDVSALKKYAGELKLNMNKFNKCLDSKKYKDEVAKDREDGEKAGVSGTPAFFVNGKFVAGLKPADYFKKLIDAELAKK